MLPAFAFRHHIGVLIDTRGAWAAIAWLATRQHGVVARWQLLELGIGRSVIARGLERGRLHVVHRGVYAVGHRALSQRGIWMAAVLAGGPGAALSHWSAAALAGLRQGGGPRSHVMVPRRRRRLDSVTFHYSQLKPAQVAVVDGIPTTAPTRTIVDLAASLPSHVLARMIEVAERSEAAVGPPLLELCEGRPGAGRVRAAAGQRRALTRSDFEATVIAKLEAAGLPRPRVNMNIAGHEVDLAWPDHSLIAELDTYATHGSEAAFERDRKRDRELAAVGWQVVRLTDADGAVADLSRLLAASAARSPSRRASAA